MPARRISSLTWRCAAWRVTGQSTADRPRGLAWARRTRCTRSSSCTQVLGDGNGSPVLPAAFERGEPNLGRVEVDVARSEREGLAHAAPGERECSGQRLHLGFRVRADCSQESLALLSCQIFPAAVVDKARVSGGGHGRRPPGGLAPERYRSLREMTTALICPAFSGLPSPAIAAAAGPRVVRKVYRMGIDRDRGAPHGATPPTPPGIRVRTTAVRSD